MNNEQKGDDLKAAEGDAKGRDNANAQQGAALGNANAKREILVDQAVINETLIREAVFQDLKSYYNNDLTVIPKPQELHLHEAVRLSLSFTNIFKIDNLTGLSKLTKLQLDNNIIEKIENLVGDISFLPVSVLRFFSPSF